MELIRIENRQGKETVNARELHEFLESKRQFANWIKHKIETYGFIENQDFTINKYVIGKATQIDYHISIDMAKELSMVENNEKGKQARQYFIEVEKKSKLISNNQFVTKNELKELLNDQRIFMQALLNQQNDFIKSMLPINNQLSLPQIELKQYTVKEYFKMKKYVLISPDYARKAIGKIATDLSKKHSRSIAYKKEDGFDAGMYDEKILETAVSVYRNERQLEKDLFN